MTSALRTCYILAVIVLILTAYLLHAYQHVADILLPSEAQNLAQL